ncbi:hypothetical protein HY631_01670 [Candidatus Uhrbacteria bacterium]|nr:hypothetical protein [Candidatus Uhrbacteria bacterium]
MRYHYKKSIEPFFKDGLELWRSSPFSRTAFLVSVVLLAGTFALPVWRLLPLSSDLPFIALHYNVYLGVDRFGPLYQIFFIPTLGLFFLLLNATIEVISWRRQRTLAHFFAGSTPLLQGILLVAMALIVLINV